MDTLVDLFLHEQKEVEIVSNQTWKVSMIFLVTKAGENDQQSLISHEKTRGMDWSKGVENMGGLFLGFNIFVVGIMLTRLQNIPCQD